MDGIYRHILLNFLISMIWLRKVKLDIYHYCSVSQSNYKGQAVFLNARLGV